MVAVTGASGFVGRALVAALEARGAAVRGLSRDDRGPAWVQGDLRDRDALARLVDGADVVLHAAGWVHRRPRPSELAEVRAINVDGTAALCEATGARPLVFVSSTAVYGDAPGPWDEDTPCAPVSAYGRTKLEAEALALARPRGAVVRPSAIVGDGAPGNLALLDRLARFGVVPVVAGGAARKSFTHVSTVVATVLAVAERLADGVPVERIVVATDDEPVTVAEVARARGARPFSVPAALARWIPPLAAAAADAVATNARMRALGVVPDPTARDWLAR